MDVRIAIPDRHVSEPVLNAGLEAVTRVNEALIKEGTAPTFSQLMKSGVKWAPEPPGQESFDHILKVAGRGWGDCDDLAPAQAASLRASGQDPGAKAVVYKSGPGRWHAIVQRGDGSLEDPSRTAGMRVRAGTRAAGIAPAVVGCMAGPSVDGAVRPFVAVRRDDKGYLARVDVPFDVDGASLSVVQHGRSPSHALAGCMAGACMLGGASGMVDDDAVDKMWAIHGLMSGEPLHQVAQICGADNARDALLTLQQIAPDLVEELRKHWQDARVLREDFDRFREDLATFKKRTAVAGAAVPFVGGRHVTKSSARRAARTLSHWAKQHHVHGDNIPGATYQGEGPSWSEHLAHERVTSPYAERFGHRGRQFVGAATMSPYLARAVDRPSSWGVSRSFGGAEAFADPDVSQVVGWGSPGAIHQGSEAVDWTDRYSHTRVASPYIERFGHRGRQFVGAAGLPFRPTLSFSLAGEHPGRAGHAPSTGRSALTQQLREEIDELVSRATQHLPPGALAATPREDLSAAILSALCSAPLSAPGIKRAGTPREMVRKGSVAVAFDRSLRAPALVLGGDLVGWDLFKDVLDPAAHAISDFAKDPGKAIENIAKSIDLSHIDLSHIDMGKALEDIGHFASDALKAAQGVISLIPGIGTGISAAISAGLAFLAGGSPIDIAVKAAYGAIPIPPGIRNVTDVVVDAALSLVHTQNIVDSAISLVRKTILDKLPSFAQGVAGTVFDTLAHLVMGFIHKKPTTAIVSPPPAPSLPPPVTPISTAAEYSALAQVAAAQSPAQLSAQAQSQAASQAAMAQAAAAAAAAVPKRTIGLKFGAKSAPVPEPEPAPAPAPLPLQVSPAARARQAEAIRIMTASADKNRAALAAKQAADRAAAAKAQEEKAKAESARLMAARIATAKAARDKAAAAQPLAVTAPATPPGAAPLVAPLAQTATILPLPPVGYASLDLLVRAMQPEVIRHMIAIPKGVRA